MAYRNTLVHTQTTSNTSYQKTTLPNGIRVISEEIPTVKSASVGVWINTGSCNESAENNGITHFIEHMVFKGTEKRSAQQIARSIESVGGFMNAFTTKEHTCYYARVLDEYLEKAVDVLGDMVQHSTFPEKEIVKEKTVVLEEIKQSEDDPDDQVHEYFEKHLFGKHPLGMQIIGTAKNVSSFTRSELNRYLKEFYCSENIIVTAAGNFRHQDLVKLVEKSFSQTKNIKHTPVESALPKSKKFYKEFPKPIQQAHLCTGTIAFGVHSKLRYPAMVMNTVLGDGMSSRLFQQVREKHGLAYSVYSFMSLMNDIGTFGIYLGTDKKNVNKSIDLAYAELEKMKSKPLSKPELQRVKAQLKGNMLLSLESTSNRMMRLGSGELYFGKYTALDEIVKNIDAVTAEDIQGVSRQLFNVENFTTVILSPNNKEYSNN
ncbi:MAG: pitrilysin family protein [Bacteroidota bacterium]|nr:pitrilysin family protein [Bacteroidota bacterium]